MLCRWTSEGNPRYRSGRHDGCFPPSTSCGSWPNTNDVTVTVEAPCFAARGCIRRRSLNGVVSEKKERWKHWVGHVADRQLTSVNASWRGCDKRMPGCSRTWPKPTV